MKGFLFSLIICLTLQAQSFWIVAGFNDAVPDTLGEEMVTNGTMELNSNWTGQATEAGDTTVQSATQKHGGSYSWRVKVDLNGEGIRSDDYTVTSGEVYYLDFWVYQVSGTITIAAYNGRYTLSQAYTPDIGVWTHIIKQVTATGTGAEKFMIRSSSIGAEFYVDDVSVKQKIN